MFVVPKESHTHFFYRKITIKKYRYSENVQEEIESSDYNNNLVEFEENNQFETSESHSENQPIESNSYDHEKSSLVPDEESQSQFDDITNTEDRTNETLDEEETKEDSSLDSKNDVEDCCISESSTLEEHGLKPPPLEESYQKPRQINRKIKISVSVSGDDQVICDSNISSDPVSLDQGEYFFHFLLNNVN